MIGKGQLMIEGTSLVAESSAPGKSYRALKGHSKTPFPGSIFGRSGSSAPPLMDHSEPRSNRHHRWRRTVRFAGPDCQRERPKAVGMTRFIPGGGDAHSAAGAGHLLGLPQVRAEPGIIRHVLDSALLEAG